MPQLTKDQVKHIAKLARLTLSDGEVEKFTKDLGAILDYVDILSEVDTEGVEPTEQVTGLTNAFRMDEVCQTGPEPDALLECSPLPITEHQIQTPSAHGPTSRETEGF